MKVIKLTKVQAQQLNLSSCRMTYHASCKPRCEEPKVRPRFTSYNNMKCQVKLEQLQNNSMKKSSRVLQINRGQSYEYSAQ